MSRSQKLNISGFALALTVLASCNNVAPPQVIAAPADVAPAPPEDIDTYARDFLNGIQPVSIAESREYCGFFVRLPDGRIQGTPPRAGTPDSCIAGFIPQNAIASYHTHGGYLPRYFNEVPSVDDVRSAIDVVLDDYVSTPGGRLWRIDGETGKSETLCGRGCLTDDPLYRPNPRIQGKDDFTLQELEELQG